MVTLQPVPKVSGFSVPDERTVGSSSSLQAVAISDRITMANNAKAVVNLFFVFIFFFISLLYVA
jgi:hypothetical protein